MATKKITELTLLTYLSSSASDVLPIVDIDADVTKKITLTSIKSGSFSGSFQGDGTNLTGVTAEWDGTHVGDARITGSLYVSGSLIPNGSGSYDLGSSTNPWKEIYVMTSSINFMKYGEGRIARMRVDGDGDFDFDSGLGLSGSLILTGSISSSGGIIIGGGIDIGGGMTLSGSISMSGSISVTDGDLTLNSGSTINVGGNPVITSSNASGDLGNTVISGSLIGTGSLTWCGPATFGCDCSSSIDNFIFSGSTEFVCGGVTGSFTGSFTGDGSGLTGVISASYALSSSHEIIKEISSSHADYADTAGSATTSTTATTAATASFVSGSNVDGCVACATSASYATTASFALNAGGTPGGSDKQVQFNDGSSFGGDSNFTWNKTSGSLLVSSSADPVTLNGLQSGGTNFVTIDNSGVLKTSEGANVTLSGSMVVSGSLTVSGSTINNIGPFNQTGDSIFTGSASISGSLTVTGGGGDGAELEVYCKTIRSRVADGVGNNGLWIYGGGGGGGNDRMIMMPNLPTADPSNAGQLWNDSNTLKISVGGE